MNGPYETTETHIQRLLERSLNSFALPGTLTRRLGSALAHASALSSAYHSKEQHRETYRHTFLLSDSSTLTLWEVVHTTRRGGSALIEVFAGEAEARAASVDLLDGPPPYDPARSEELFSDIRSPAAEDLLASAAPPLPRVYVSDNSADHARRVLRRAENDDRPGEDTARLLRTAFAHDIAQVFGDWSHLEPVRAAFMLYEHAFLLIDGTETSLWEVEHTATPDGRHMYEVYGDEVAARAALERRARVR